MRNTEDSRRFLALLVLTILAASAALSGQTGPVAIGIEIGPGTNVKAIDPSAGGSVPVALFGSSSVDVRRFDLTTIALAGAPIVAQRNGTLQGVLNDVNRDGFLDLIVDIAVDRLRLSPRDTRAVLRVIDFDGTIYEGAAPIVTEVLHGGS